LATGLGWVGSQKMDPRPCLVPHPGTILNHTTFWSESYLRR